MVRILSIISISFWVLLTGLSTAQARPLAADEQVMFIPDFARELDGDLIEVNIQAWVYEPETRPGLTTLFTRYLGINHDELSDEEQSLFARRSQFFKTDSERGKTIPLLLAGTQVELPVTNAAGRSHGRFLLYYPEGHEPVRQVAFMFDSEQTQQKIQGEIAVIAQEGLSVVSDIDDTIKVSHVLDRKQLLHKTFLQPFADVSGMAGWYSRMAEEGAAFHYLTSSPVQLYPALADFMAESGFPEGSMHMRESTSWRTLVPFGNASRQHKHATLERLLNAFPKRKFILIGDSGEADPEIYADVARRYPQQVVSIHIRNVTEEDRDAPRYLNTFSGIPEERWQIFSDPEHVELDAKPIREG